VSEAALQEQLAADRPPHAGPSSQLGAAIVAGFIGVGGLIGSLALGLGRLTQPGPRSSVLTAVAVLTLVVFAAVLPLIGFEIPSLLLAFVWLRFLGRESWISSVVTSVGTVAAFYVLFVLVLQIPLPRLI